jgi:DNA-binding transcriptional ArsR family regulator
MPRRELPFYIHAVAKIAAIASPVRAAIIDALDSLGPATILQLAGTVGYPPDGLYYHLNMLEKNGLVVRADPEPGTGAARFDLPGHPATLSYRLEDTRQREATTRVVASMLRSAERSFRRGFAPGAATVDGPHRNLRAGRRVAWLTDRELEQLNRHIERIHALFRRSGPSRKGARLHEFTYVLAPVGKNGRRGRPSP